MAASKVERQQQQQQQRRPRNEGNPRAGGPEQAAEIERLLAMLAERDQALAALEDARLEAQSHESALEARIAELKAKVAELAPQAGRRRPSIRGGDGPLIRLYDELPLGKDGGGYRDDVDWTADEELVQEVLESLMRVQPKVRAEDASLVAKLADLLERAGPQFIVAARRHVAATEAEAAARAAARVKAKAASPTGKPTTKRPKAMAA
jgi:DNA repair exonuclease SbcCD ATPase subunit